MTELNSTNKWKHDAWYKFHKRAVDYPYYPNNFDVKDVTHFYYKNFLSNVNCDTCRNDYLRLINQNPIRPGSKSELFMWTIDIHNAVNQKLGKPLVNYEDAFRAWNIEVLPPQQKRSIRRIPITGTQTLNQTHATQTAQIPLYQSQTNQNQPYNSYHYNPHYYHNHIRSSGYYN